MEVVVRENQVRRAVEVIYATPCFLEKNAGKVGQLTEPREFASVEAAKTAPLPDGCSFAGMPIEGGVYVFSAAFGWEFQRSPAPAGEGEADHAC